MSKASRSNVEDDSSASDTPSLEDTMRKMAAQLAQMNKNFEGMQGKIELSVASAVAPINNRIDRMEHRYASELHEIRSDIERRIGKGQDLPRNGFDTKESPADSYAKAANRRTMPQTSRSPSASTSKISRQSDTAWFWAARKCLRFFPVKGDNEAQLTASLDDFVAAKLKIPSGSLSSSDISFVRRVCPNRKSKINNEVIVGFTSVDARDLVQSYARNLGEWVDKDGRPEAGIRMEI